MVKMTQEEWQNLYENFETTWILDAVDHIDNARGYLGDGENWKPPQMRTDLLKLHQMAMDIVNNGLTSKARDFFDSTFDLEVQVSDLIEELEAVQDMLNKLIDLYPKNLT